MKTHNFATDRAPDLFRGRTGTINAGVGTAFGTPFDGPPVVAGDFYVYDPVTDTWTIVNTADIGSDIFLTKYAGAGHDKYTNLAAGATATIDCSLANIFDLTLTANCTLTITNPPDPSLGGIIWVILRQGGSGSYTVTWPLSVVWQAADGTATGSAPTLHTVVTASDAITLATLDGGTTWGGQLDGSATGGTVTSVALTVPAELSVSGSPVTGSGTLAVTKATQTANTVWAGPTSGAAAQPTFRALDAADIPVGVVVGAAAHAHVTGETHLSDGSTTTYTLDEAFEPGSVEAFNTTTLAYLVVTETAPDQAAVSAAGSSGDKITFSYAGALA